MKSVWLLYMQYLRIWLYWITGTANQHFNEHITPVSIHFYKYLLLFKDASGLIDKQKMFDQLGNMTELVKSTGSSNAIMALKVYPNAFIFHTK